MASIAKLSVQMAWQGAELTKGAADASKDLKNVGDKAKKTKEELEALKKEKDKLGEKKLNLAESLGLKSLNDVKGLLDMARGVFQFFVGLPIQGAVSILKMGGALETMTIRAQYAAKSIEAGNKVIKDLRDLSSSSGVPLQDLAKAFEQFTAAGISTAGASTILANAGNAIELLGGGASGAQAVAAAITEIRGAAIATDGPLKTLQRGGLKVFEALAQELEAVTGNAYSVEEAMAAVQQGSVSSATAVRAVFRASNSPEAKAAAEAFGASFDGQLRQLSSGFNDLLTEIGKQMLAILQPEKAFSALKGAFQGVKEVVQEIAAAFLPVVDPKDKAAGLASIFESSKQIAKDVVNKLVEGITQLKGMFDEVVAGIRKLMQDYQGMTAGKVATTAATTVVTAPFEIGKAMTMAVGDFVKGPRVDPNRPGQMTIGDEVRAQIKLEKEIASKSNLALISAMSSFLQLNNELPKVGVSAEEAAVNAKNLAYQQKLNAQFALEQAENEKKANLDLELATKDNAKLTATILNNNMTITEKFAEMTGNLESMMAQAAKGSKESADKLRAAQTRVVGKQLQDMIKQFATPQAGTAQAFVAGSAGAAEAQIRARVESINANVDPQKQLVAAAAEAARQDAIQAVQMARLVKAAENANIIKPGTLVIPK
jgi:hypothetical protein